MYETYALTRLKVRSLLMTRFALELAAKVMLVAKETYEAKNSEKNL